VRLYLAGPMTGRPDYNHAMFYAFAGLLEQAGYEVVNPATFPIERTWLEAMGHCLLEVSKCQGVATLPGWDESRGARLEVALAKEGGLPVKGVADWLDSTGRR
jgi:hypothetical protein